MKKLLLISFLSVASGVSEAQAEVPVVGGPVTNTATGRIYYLLAASTWRDAEAQAVKLGGHLATVRSKAEQDWIVNTFYGWGGDTNRSLWIGLNDSRTEGQFVWTSGEPVTYTNWRSGEPNDAFGDEDYTEMMIDGAMRGQPDFGQWNDLGGADPDRAGLVEISPRYVWHQWRASEGGNDHFYTLTALPYANWFDAEAEAQLFGGYLASINSAAEQAFIEAVFLSGQLRSNIYWIGLNDIVREGMYVWSSGEPLTYTNWAPLEPNDEPPGEDAVVLNWYLGRGQGDVGKLGQWNDWYASNPPREVCWFRGIIETPAVGTVFTKVTSGDVVSDPTTVSRTGVAWVDYDDDGHEDLFVSVYGGPNLLYHNRGDGTFEKVKTGSLATDAACCLGGAWADYDNDGWLDVFVPVLDCGQPNSLYRGSGCESFSKVGLWPFTQDQARSVTAAWADYDNDGFADLFVANSASGQYNFLYRNRGDGTFGRISTGSIVNEVVRSPCASWCDYDNDGDLDLFVTSEGAERNRLYRNNGDGSFTKITSGVVVSEGGASAGCAWADYNNDGFLDLFVAKQDGTQNLLYKNNGDGTFARVGQGPIASDAGHSLGCAWGDYDNDGFLDLFVANWNGERNCLYHNNGDGTFGKVTEGSVVNEVASSRGCAWGDFDNDGFLDLFVSNDVGEHSFLYRSMPNGNHWLKVKLVGTLSNRSAIGAKVRTETVIRGTRQRQLREISGGSGYGSQNSLLAHFGLGNATLVETLRIEWPSGIVQRYEGVAVDQFLTITEPPVLRAVGMSWPGQFELVLTSRGGFSYQVERSTDCQTWISIQRFYGVNGSVQVVDLDAAPLQHAFYRAVEIPQCGPGLVSWWAAEGSGLDEQGRFDLQAYGGVGYAPGVFGQAFDIDPAGGRLQTAAPPITKLDDWTLETWVYWRGLDPLEEHRTHFALNVGHTGKNGFGLFIADRGLCRVESWRCGQEGMLFALYGGITLIPTGYYPKPHTWTHLALSRRDGVLRLYANGTEVFSVQTGDPNPPSEPAYVGHPDQWETFDGLVDEPRVWSRALSAREIREIYRVGALRLAVGR